MQSEKETMGQNKEVHQHLEDNRWKRPCQEEKDTMAKEGHKGGCHKKGSVQHCQIPEKDLKRQGLKSI